MGVGHILCFHFVPFHFFPPKLAMPFLYLSGPLGNGNPRKYHTLLLLMVSSGFTYFSTTQQALQSIGFRTVQRLAVLLSSNFSSESKFQLYTFIQRVISSWAFLMAIL